MRPIRIAAIAALSSLSTASAQEILRDDFNGGSIDLTKWQVMTHIVGRSQFGNTPVVSSGFARLRHDTYNPGAPGSLFRGTELATNAMLSRGTMGIELEARVRSNSMPNGLVTSFFTYISRNQGGTVFSDEIDFEFLSSRSNSVSGSDPVLASTYNDFNNTTQPYGDEVTQSSREYVVAGLDLTQFNSFRIKWLPNRLEWYANGRLLRTVTGSLVPTDATRARFNFWAPGAEWPAAYSSALVPTSNPALNQSAFYDVDWMVVRHARPPVSATASDRVFTDRFSNGQVANSDSITSFWQQRNQGGSTVVESTAEPLKLTATGSGYPHAQIASGVRSEFNFFESPIELQATGINFDSPSNSYGKAYLRFSLSSQALTAGSQSEYTSEDAFSVRIGADQTVAVGYKVNSPNVSTEFEGINVLNETVSGPVRRLNLIVQPGSFTLEVEHDLSLADGTPVVSQFNGTLGLSLSDWRVLAATATGNSALYVQSQLSNSLAGESATAFVESLAVNAVRPTWNVATAGNWDNPTCWTRNLVPNYAGANAILGSAIAGPQTIAVNSSITLGRLTFQSLNSYTLAGAGLIAMNTPAAAAKVEVLSGNHVIAVPVNASMNAQLSVAAGSSLVLSGGLTGAASATIVKDGTGTLSLKNIRGGALSVSAGKVRITPSATNNDPSGTSSLGAFGIDGGPAMPAGTVDLTNNAMVVDYTLSSSLPTIAGYLTAGYAGGAWTGNGITSSSAQAAASTSQKTALGFAEATDLFTTFPAMFAGQSVDNTSVLLLYTLAGDATLDGTVNSGDFNLLATNFGSAGQRWYTGDFTYNGTVDSADFNVLASNFGKTLAGGLGGSVPEPTSICFVLSAAIVFTRSFGRRTFG